jgi:hypothetical protein
MSYTSLFDIPILKNESCEFRAQAGEENMNSGNATPFCFVILNLPKQFAWYAATRQRIRHVLQDQQGIRVMI